MPNQKRSLKIIIFDFREDHQRRIGRNKEFLWTKLSIKNILSSFVQIMRQGDWLFGEKLCLLKLLYYLGLLGGIVGGLLEFCDNFIEESLHIGVN